LEGLLEFCLVVPARVGLHPPDGLSKICVTPMISSDEVSNFELFRDCLSTVVIERLAPATNKQRKRVKGRKNEIKPVVQTTNEQDGEANAAELSEFTEVRKISHPNGYRPRYLPNLS
jgi:hypothetical protein